MVIDSKKRWETISSLYVHIMHLNVILMHIYLMLFSSRILPWVNNQLRKFFLESSLMNGLSYIVERVLDFLARASGSHNPTL
jgi:hypothetical protein